MPLIASTDWLFVSAGWLLMGGGVLLAMWALFYDRPRGRRRCSRCWYDLGGIGGLKCPECGREARNERQLFRTRRRWRWTSLALVAFVGALVVWQVPAVQRAGWWAAAPRPVLIGMIPHVEHDGQHIWPAPPTTLMQQIDSRLFVGEWELARLWWPERWWLANRARRAVMAEDSPDFTRALGARALVLTRRDPLAGMPEGRLGPIILARTALSYASATTYRDRGMTRDGFGDRVETYFITALDRTGERRFRFEYISGHSHQQRLSRRYAIWAHGDRTWSWWTLRPQTQTDRSLPMALAGATGVSKGNAHRLPRILLPEVRGRSIFTDLQDVAFVGIETLPEPSHLDERPCYRIEAFSMGHTYTMWIDAEQFLLLRIDEDGPFPRFTIYEPELDIETDDSWFEFDPEQPELSPLQDPN